MYFLKKTLRNVFERSEIFRGCFLNWKLWSIFFNWFFSLCFFSFSDRTIWGYRFQPVGAGPSQVDEVVLGHDIDCSTELTQLLLEGAAGIKSIGQTARVEARRHIPGGGDSQVDELIWGSDVDGSADPRIMEAKAQLFQGAAGTLPIRTEGRELWCCKIKGEFKRLELTKSLWRQSLLEGTELKGVRESKR